MKIKEVRLNFKKKSVEIKPSKGASLSIPFVKLPKVPTLKDPLISAIVDADLAHRAVTIQYKSGAEESVHLDAFLEYNQDPSHLRELALHDLTLRACEYLEASGLSKHEVIRRLGTSPSQLYRLLDPANTRKSIDEMIKLLAILGYRVEWRITNCATAAA